VISPGEIMSARFSTPSTRSTECSFYKDGIDRGEKAAHVVDPENREEHLKRLAEAGIDVQEMMPERAPTTIVRICGYGM
jgi:hypothetical protein